jgi:hypothetical protein
LSLISQILDKLLGIGIGSKHPGAHFHEIRYSGKPGQLRRESDAPAFDQIPCRGRCGLPPDHSLRDIKRRTKPHLVKRIDKVELRCGVYESLHHPDCDNAIWLRYVPGGTEMRSEVWWRRRRQLMGIGNMEVGGKSRERKRDAQRGQERDAPGVPWDGVEIP